MLNINIKLYFLLVHIEDVFCTESLFASIYLVYKKFYLKLNCDIVSIIKSLINNLIFYLILNKPKLLFVLGKNTCKLNTSICLNIIINNNLLQTYLGCLLILWLYYNFCVKNFLKIFYLKWKNIIFFLTFIFLSWIILLSETNQI